MQAKLFFCLTTATLTMTSVLVQPAKTETMEFFNLNDFLDSAGNVTTVGFDNLPVGDGILSGTEFSNLGLTIVQRDGLPINVLSGSNIGEGFPSNVNSEPNVISSSFVVGGFNDANSDNFDFLLANPSFSAGLWIGNIGSSGNDTTEIQFLDNFGRVIASEILGFNTPGLISGTSNIAIGNNRVFYGITSTEPISTIRTIELAFDGDGITYDDIQFGASSANVSEPHLFLGMLFSLGIGTLVRRKVRVA